MHSFESSICFSSEKIFWIKEFHGARKEKRERERDNSFINKLIITINYVNNKLCTLRKKKN